MNTAFPGSCPKGQVVTGPSDGFRRRVQPVCPLRWPLSVCLWLRGCGSQLSSCREEEQVELTHHTAAILSSLQLALFSKGSSRD